MTKVFDMRCAAGLAIAAAVSLSAFPAPLRAGEPATAKVYCVVADPSPTPLNLRTAPYGRVFGNVRNGTRVTVFDNAVDANGKPWVFLVGDDEVPLGWAYKNFVRCP